MKIIEPHIHMLARTTDDYQRMAVSGICAVIEPAFWLGHDRKYAGSFFDYFDLLLEFESQRARKYGIEHYSCIGVNPKEANNIEIAKEVISKMGDFLDREKVVGVGEIGLDKITDAEEEVLRLQIRLGIEKKLPLLIHTPHNNKVEGTKIILKVIDEEKADPRMTLIDHNVEDTIEMSLDSGCWSGMTLYPVTKMSSERAIEVLKKYGVERMMINSSADWGYSDPLMVPMTCYKMSQCGFSEDQIKKLVFDNPYSFYSKSNRFKLN